MQVPSSALALPDWGVIRAHGDDAASFLHGQLTQDITHLAIGQARLAGYCSAKGRLLATFVVMRTAADEFLLACSADLLAATLRRLSMFVLRARCKLSDASADVALMGVAGVPAGAWQGMAHHGGTLVGLPPAKDVARALWLAPIANATALDLPPLDAARWSWLEVSSGIPRVVAATAEQFVPQMVNLELVGGVDFGKGCYPGQEVVARSQYRGTLKRRAFAFDSDAAARPGQELFHSEDAGQPAGMVVLAASCDARHRLLAEVKLNALAGGSLHLGGVGTAALRQVALPYAIPVEAAP